MKTGELWADEETKAAASYFAGQCSEYADDFDKIRDAFIAGAVWILKTRYGK